MFLKTSDFAKEGGFGFDATQISLARAEKGEKILSTITRLVEELINELKKLKI